MAITELNHYFVRANDLERTKRFYCEALGFEVMPRPALDFPGYWLGVNGKVQVHMGPHGIADAALYYMGTTARSATDNAGVVDHIAFQAEDAASFSRRFEALGLASRRRYIAEIELLQLFINDPDGLTIELNFPGVTAEHAAAG
jgi:catechol 2,3-dioxygenase-like lactoylglutathione lyase family enzyme